MFDLESADIKEIHQAYKGDKLTVKDLVLGYLERIAKLDQGKDGLNSILELNPDLLFIADSFDQRLKRGEEPKNLFGIPVLLKDSINTEDRLHTSAGSVALADNYAPYDAWVAQRLRQAGAIILGKANMTEFANFMSNEGMPSGYSSRGGRVLNPYNRQETPSGSSSGSAVAVAASLATVSIGTETSGSIVSPARINGIVGIKPTLGLVGRTGIVPIAGTLDTAGPMAKTVRDAAIVLEAIASFDPNDPATELCPAKDARNYVNMLDGATIAGLRIGVIHWQKGGKYEPHGEDRKVFAGFCQKLTTWGAVLIDNLEFEQDFPLFEIMRYEFKASLNYYLSTLGEKSKRKTLQEIIQYNQENASVALRYGQGLLLESVNRASGRLIEPQYLRALAKRQAAAEDFNRLFEKHNLDVIVAESFPAIAPFAGFPSLTIPIGQRADLVPIGSFWVARRFDEMTLIKAAFAAEELLGLRLKPSFGV